MTVDDTRALRDRLEEAQVALREARAEAEALRRRVAELAEALRLSHEHEERLLRESDARGARVLALSAELDRYRASARRAEPPARKLEVRPKEGGPPKPPPPPPKRAPKPPAASREPSPAAEPGPHSGADDEPAPAGPAPSFTSRLPPIRPNNPRPLTPGRIIVGGSAEEGPDVGPGGERLPPAAAAGCALPVLTLVLLLAAALASG